jgi:lysophospholipase L1-like esterase
VSIARTRRPALLGAIAVALVVTAGIVPVPGAAAQPRRVVVVGDSIILGARGPLESTLGRDGWATTFDAAVNRSTLAGAGVVRRHGPDLGDSLVVSLGANDAGNPATFRQRVDAVMAAAAFVPHVYWLTIREVRPYYRSANQVLRDATTRFPNLRLVDWNGATAGAPGLTAGDGLHLTPAGAKSMAGLVTTSVRSGAKPQPPPGPPSTAGPEPAVSAVPPPAPTTAAPAPTTAAPATAAPTGPTTSVPATSLVTTAAPTTATPTTATPTTVPGSVTGTRAAADAADGSVLGALGRTLGLGLVAVVAVLGLAGAWIAVWALWRTRGRAATSTGSVSGPTAEDAVGGGTAPPSVAGSGRSARSSLRAERIAAARSHHPTAVPVVPEWAPGRPTASSGSGGKS